eukprot:3490962-Rhodomonas_salina.4
MRRKHLDVGYREVRYTAISAYALTTRCPVLPTCYPVLPTRCLVLMQCMVVCLSAYALPGTGVAQCIVLMERMVLPGGGEGDCRPPTRYKKNCYHATALLRGVWYSLDWYRATALLWNVRYSPRSLVTCSGCATDSPVLTNGMLVGLISKTDTLMAPWAEAVRAVRKR